MSTNRERTGSTETDRAGPSAFERLVRTCLRWCRTRTLLLAAICICGLLLWGPAWLAHGCRWRGQAALQRQDWAAAETWLARAQQFQSGNARTEFLWARLDRKLGRLNETAQHLRLATERGYDPAAIEREAWCADAQAGALALLESHLAELLITGDDAPEICEAFVHGCLLTYRLDDALRILKLWQADYPADPQPHYLRGRILEHRVDLEQAAVEYREALRLAPRHAPAAFNLGRVLLTQQHPAEALIQYQHCARDLYDPQPGLIGMARCLRLLGRFDEARQRLQQALESPRARLDVAYRLVGEPLEKAQAEAIAELGEVELAEEHYAEAEQHLRAGLAVNPHNWRVRYSLATTLRQQGKRDAAGEELRQVEETKQALAECDLLMDRLRRNPADVEARLHVGKVFLKYVSENQGLIWLQSVLTYNATHRETHRILAEYYAHREPESPEYKRLAEHHRRLAKSEPAAAVSEN